MKQRAAGSRYGFSPGKALAIWAGLALLLVLVTAGCLAIGQERIDIARAFGFGVAEGERNIDRQILLVARLPRVLFAAVAGASLALAGAVYQALLRNDLADPYTLGVSGGASFGALLTIVLIPSAFTSWALPLCTFLFAAMAVVFIYRLARLRSLHTTPAKLILAGVTLNLLFGAGILLLQYISNPHQTFSMIRWMMGGADVGSMRVVAYTALILALGLAVVLPRGRTLNVLSLGEMTATHLGVNVETNRRLLLIATSLMTASVVAYAGPIGFVGLLVPHAVRLMLGADHRLLLPAVALAGGTFLVLCDTIGRTVLLLTSQPLELPVGIITAFLGAPFFFWLLFRRPA